MDILLSAFEPFNGRAENISQKVVHPLSQKLDLPAIDLPVSFDRAFVKLSKEILESKPELVLTFGESSLAQTLKLEMVALNIAHASIPDNDGNMPKNEKIDGRQILALSSMWDVNPISKFLRKEELPMDLSYHAGTFVCNHLFFDMINNQKDLNCSVGFIHCPVDESLISVNDQILVLQKFVYFLLENPHVCAWN